jgi:hypothetical protein
MVTGKSRHDFSLAVGPEKLRISLLLRPGYANEII